MTNSDKTLVAALLDRTGSMSSSKRATEEGWAELINEQKKQPGECLVTLAQFDLAGGFGAISDSHNVVEWVYRNTPVADVPEFILVPRGTTPLLDAIGIFVTEIGKQLAALPESERPGTVIAVIMTDGGENASREWSRADVKALITTQREKYNWKFMFLGANIDAVKTGTSMGFTADASITYDSHDYLSNRAVYAAAGANVTGLRSGNLAAASFSVADRSAAMGGKGSEEEDVDSLDDKKLRKVGLSGSSR